MRFDAGTTDVPSAGTRVQISNTTHKIRKISVQARDGNAGKVYFGVSDVSASNGWELAAGEIKDLDFEEGSVPFSEFWVGAATNGDDMDWAVIIR